MSSDARMAGIALSLREVSKTYLLYRKPVHRLLQTLWRGRRVYATEFSALKPLSLEIKRGETVGLLGRNGSGKSTLLQLVCGVLTPTGGNVVVHGRISALLELGAGFNPDFTGRENIALNGAIMGLSPQEVAARYDEIVAFAQIGEFIEQPVRTYSSGMFVRLAFAVAVASDPDILVVDEALAVGDEAFQRKCYARIAQMKARGATILFVSHSIQAMTEVCDRIVLMDAGERLAEGSPKDMVARYHKLIYADPRLQAQIREEIKAGAALPASAPIPTFDPGLAPESRVDYPEEGGVLSDPWLEDESGARVNLLHPGKAYTYRYRFTAHADLQSLLFGMMVKTKTGIELGGQTVALDTLGAGESAEIRFRFTCRFLSGTYFLNCGCVTLVGHEERYIHRLVDAVQFEVVQGGDQTPARPRGLVDFGMAGSVGPGRP